MPSLSAGGVVTGLCLFSDSISIQTQGGFAQFESPIGTTLAQFTGTRTFGPYANQTFKITALTGPMYYELNDGFPTGTTANAIAVISSGGAVIGLQNPDGSTQSLGGGSSGLTLTAYSAAIPLDLVNGREMSAVTLSTNTVLTVQASPPPVFNGNCNLTLMSNGTATLDAAAFTVKGPDTFSTVAGQINELTFLQRTIGQKPYMYCSLGALIDITAPFVVGSPHVDNTTPTIVRQLYSEALVTNGIGASDCTVSGSTAASVAISGTELQITVSAAIASGTTPNLSVNANVLKDAAGNLCAAIVSQAITNNVIPAAPVITLGTPTSTTQPMTLTAPAGATSRLVQVRTTTGPGAWGNAAGSFVGNVFTATGLPSSTSEDYQANSTGTAGTSGYGSIVTGATTAASSNQVDTLMGRTAAAIGTASDGGTWSGDTSLISTNASTGAYASVRSVVYRNLNSASGGVKATLNLGSVPAANQALILRGDGTSSNYLAVYFAANISLYSVVGGTSTFVANPTGGASFPGFSNNQLYDCEVVVSGTTIDTYINGAYTGSFTGITTGQTNTWFGFQSSADTAARWRQWQAYITAPTGFSLADTFLRTGSVIGVASDSATAQDAGIWDTFGGNTFTTDTTNGMTGGIAARNIGSGNGSVNVYVYNVANIYFRTVAQIGAGLTTNGYILAVSSTGIGLYSRTAGAQTGPIAPATGVTTTGSGTNTSTLVEAIFNAGNLTVKIGGTVVATWTGLVFQRLSWAGTETGSGSNFVKNLTAIGT